MNTLLKKSSQSLIMDHRHSHKGSGWSCKSIKPIRVQQGVVGIRGSWLALIGADVFRNAKEGPLWTYLLQEGWQSIF